MLFLAAWLPPGCCLVAAWLLPGCRLAAAWVPRLVAAGCPRCRRCLDNHPYQTYLEEKPVNE